MSKSFSLHEFFHKQKLGILSESVNESFKDPLEGLPQNYKDLLRRLQRTNVPIERRDLINKMNVIRKGLNLKPLTQDLNAPVNEEDYDQERDAQAMGYPSAAAAAADNWGRPKNESEHELEVHDEMTDSPAVAQDPTEENPKVDQHEYTKYESVDELMKEIERSTDEAALKHKMERVKAAYTALEEKATALEEGDNAEFVSKSKVKEMKNNSKKLRKMHEKYEKIYEKRYAKDEKKHKKANKTEKVYESSTLLKDIIRN